MFAMKAGIVSDSHDCYENVLKAVEIFQTEKVDYVLHAGDIVSPRIAQLFAQVNGAEFIAVFGNCDLQKQDIRKAVEQQGGRIYDNFFAGDICGKKIYMTHRTAVVDEIASNGMYDMVIYGHTHARDVRKINDCLIINPGPCMGKAGDSAGVSIVDLDNLTAGSIKFADSLRS